MRSFSARRPAVKLLPLLLLSFSGAGMWPVLGRDTPVPDIKPRMEYEFETTGGAAYLVEGSGDGQAWVPLTGPIFGDGKPARGLLPATAEGFKQVRVRPVPAADIGPATTALGGKTLALNDNGRVRQVVLFPAIQGVTRGFLKTDASHARSFTWHIRRISAAGVSVRLLFFDGTWSSVDLTFSNGRLGMYQMRDRTSEGAVQTMDEGVFSVHDGRILDEPRQTRLPVTLTGQTLGFEEGGALTLMDFPPNATVLLTKPDGSTETRDYVYERKGPGLGELRVTPLGRPSELFNLVLDSQATGTFNRFPLAFPGGFPIPGALPQAGTFNVPSVTVLPSSNTGPPRSLEGRVIQIQGENPVTLTFNSDGTGMATREDNGSVEMAPFIYDYSPADGDGASLALTYPGAQTDRVEDYDLDFSGQAGGSFTGSVYEGGELAGSTSGSFNTGGA